VSPAACHTSGDVNLNSIFPNTPSASISLGSICSCFCLCLPPSCLFPHKSYRQARTAQTVPLIPWTLSTTTTTTSTSETNPWSGSNSQQSATMSKVDYSWNVMAHGDSRVGNWRGKLANAVGSKYPSHYLGIWCTKHYYRWCAHIGCQQSTELTPTGRFKWIRPFRRKTKSDFCACAITFQTQSTTDVAKASSDILQLPAIHPLTLTSQHNTSTSMTSLLKRFIAQFPAYKHFPQCNNCLSLLPPLPSVTKI